MSGHNKPYQILRIYMVDRNLVVIISHYSHFSLVLELLEIYCFLFPWMKNRMDM